MTLYKNKNLLKLAIILSVFFGFFLGFNNGNVFAVDDISVTFSGQVNRYNNVFTNCTETCLDNYQYLIVESSSNVGNDLIHLFIRFDGSHQSDFYIATSSYGSNYSIYKLPFNGTPNNFLQWGSNYTFISDLKLTLTDSLPGSSSPSGSLDITENGIFDVSDVASVNVNVPQDVTEIIQDPISNDFQKVFFKIVENIIPAFGILLVVWFGIDMLSSLIFGRGR